MKGYLNGNISKDSEFCCSRNYGGQKDVAGTFKVPKAGVSSEFYTQWNAPQVGGGIKTLSDEEKLRELVANKPALKDILQAEEKIRPKGNLERWEWRKPQLLCLVFCLVFCSWFLKPEP